MSVDALARQLATADPAVVARFLETCDPDEAAAVEAALTVLERGRVLDLVDAFPTLPPDEAEAILETLTDEQTALLREELDVRDLEAFLAGRRAEDVRAAAEIDGCTWFSALFPSYARAGFAPHMREVWEWAWTIRRRERVRPLAAIWFRGGSKALAVETPIATPYGWTTMGDLQPGSVVFDHRGQAVVVTGVSPIEEKPASRVSFRGGAAIVASDDHLWALVDRPVRRAWEGAIPSDWPTWKGRRPSKDVVCGFNGCEANARTKGLCSAHYEQLRKGQQLLPVHSRSSRGGFDELAVGTLTTEAIAASPLRWRNEYRWTIPTGGVLDLPDAWLPIDPYLLGCWLGDGTSMAGIITVGKPDRAEMGALLEATDRSVSWREREEADYATIGGLRADLRRGGILGNKHVPSEYLRGSSKQRLALLQGMLDTDGSVKRAGAAFSSTRQVLALNAAELARTLGMRASVGEGRAMLDGRDCGPVWTVLIAASGQPLFRMPRKLNRQLGAVTHDLHGRMHYLSDIEPVGTRAVRCIVVDSPGHCFLAGEHMIPTHNSSTAEGVTAALGARGARGYGLYVSGTQAQADRHVGTLGAMLESKRFAAAYPDMARRAVGQYGASKGWSRTRLSTAAGFTVDALGLGVEARGIRMEEERPDFIVLDDVDALSDGPAMVEKKIRLLTETILPSGSPDLVVLAIQNVIHPNSIFARLANMADTPADFLADRIISGPVPAVLDLDVQPEPTAEGGTRWTVRGGTPTWPDGFGLGAVQAAIDTYGLTAFLREGQHVVNAAPGGMFDHLTYRHADPGAVPFLVRRVCWVDPAVTNTDTSDACAIQLDGLDAAGQVWRLWSWEARSTPLRALSLAIRAAHRYGCPYVGVETDQGGDTWESVYREACRTVTTEDPERPGQALDGGEILGMETLPGFTWAKAGSTHESKVERAARMLVEYEGPRAPVHVIGTHVILEAALNRFGPKGTKPFDLTDACLVAGTTVDTADGPVPIEHVAPGMSVWTRAGLAPVAAAGRTGTGRPVYEATTADGRKLVGTADHPVWTKEQGWTPLSECAGLTLLRRSKSSTEVACTGATSSPSDELPRSTTSQRGRAPAKQRRSTGRSGSTTTARSRTAGTSTTATRTRSTTTRATSTHSHAASTAVFTAPLGTTVTRWSSISPASVPAPRKLTGRMSRGRGSRLTPSVNGSASPPANGRARSAASGSRAVVPSRRGTARSDAGVGWPRPTPASGRLSARFAAESSPADGAQVALADSAGSRVVTVRLLPDSADVWNLEVNGPHEFFANGLLVHNCYWAWRDLRKGGTATVQAPPLAPVRAPISTPRGGGMIRVPTGRVNGASRLR